MTKNYWKNFKSTIYFLLNNKENSKSLEDNKTKIALAQHSLCIKLMFSKRELITSTPFINIDD